MYTGVYLYACIKEKVVRRPVRSKMMDDELTELLAEILIGVYMLYPFVEERECKWYTCVIDIHSWRKKSEIGLPLLSHSSRKENANGVHV